MGKEYTLLNFLKNIPSHIRYWQYPCKQQYRDLHTAVISDHIT